MAYDSGAELPAFNDLKWFIELRLLEKPAISIGTAGGTISILGGVAAYKTTLSSGEEVTMKLREAIYNPRTPMNLISSGLLQDEGIYWDQKRHILYDAATGRVVTELRRAGNLFVATNSVPAAAAFPALDAGASRNPDDTAVPVPVAATASHLPAVTSIASPVSEGFSLTVPAGVAQTPSRTSDPSGALVSQCEPGGPFSSAYIAYSMFSKGRV